MKAFLWYVGVPLLINAAAALLAAFLRKKKTPDGRDEPLRFSLATVASILVFSALHLIVLLFFHVETVSLPPVSVVAASLCFTVGFALPGYGDLAVRRPMLTRFFKRVGVLAVAALLIETAVCNFQSVSLNDTGTSLSPADGTVLGGAQLTDQGLSMGVGSTLSFTREVEGDTVTLRFIPQDTMVTVTIAAKDDNFSQSLKPLAEQTVTAAHGWAGFSIGTYGTIHELRITVSGITDPLVLQSVSVSNAAPFAFNSLRFLLLLGVAIVIAAVRLGRLYRVCYDSRDLRHHLLIACCLVLCLSVHTALLSPCLLSSREGAATITYPFENQNAGSRDAYVQQFDAFYKGQLHLDIEPNETLTALEDPYDYSLRHGSDTVYYQWDRAYYNGKYYSYFGVAPLLTFYVPFYWLTGALPSVSVTCGFFSLIATVFLFLLLLELVRRFCGRVNLLMLMLGLVATAGTTGLWWFHILASDYTVPLCAGLCFLFFTLWAGLCACDTQKYARQLLLFVLCGVGAVLTVASRPTLVFGALLLAPPFIGLLAQRGLTRRRKAGCVAAFAVPLGIGAALIMVYNQLRFGSPVEFGATYQLTVSNVAANTLSLSLLPAAIYHYFLQPLEPIDRLPFLQPAYVVLNNYGRYLYADRTVGALLFPHLCGSLIALPGTAKRTDPVKRWMLILTPVLALTAAFCDLCLGGAHIRYTADVLPVLCVTALPILLWLYEYLSQKLGHGVFVPFVLLFGGSLFVSLCCCKYFIGANTLLNEAYGQFWPKLEELLFFWC